MLGTMMSTPLTLDRIIDRAATFFAHVTVVSRRPDKSLQRTSVGEVIARARRLARALVHAGIKPGDRVATLMWNNAHHLEAYAGIPLAGAVVHTLNLRLHPDDICYIARDAGDRVLLVDEVLWPLYEKCRDNALIKPQFERVLVVGSAEYEDFLERAPDVPLPALTEEQALGMCYTSGTTGRPKGVVYTHRSTLLHSLVSALPDTFCISRADTLLPVVPMFHVNAWGLPYAALFMGTRLVFPGPHLDAESLLELVAGEKVTLAAGVPTIWLNLREALEAQPGRWQLQPGLRFIVGGAAAPEQLIRDFDRLGIELVHAWGMTETSPIGLVAKLPPELRDRDADERYHQRAKQGAAAPLVDVRVRNEAGDVPRDGKTTGEIEVRGPWVTARYFNSDESGRWTGDGFFRTGDVANLDEHGFVKITDRVADLIKSGGEWIASAELENALMDHPAVREAAVVGAPHPKWSERPLAVVVLKPGASASPEELKQFLAPRFAKFWLPDAFVFADAIPRTSAGKFKKTELRQRFRDWKWQP
jgi:fatty-acyl-CoA synthase